MICLVLTNSRSVFDSAIVSPILPPFAGPLDFSRKILFPDCVARLKLLERGLTIRWTVFVYVIAGVVLVLILLLLLLGVVVIG